MKIIGKIVVFVFLVCGNVKGQSFEWAKSFGGSGLERAEGISIDPFGNIYTTGLFESTVDFDQGPGTMNLSSIGMADIFIQKTDSSGNFIWARSFGGALNDYGYAVTSDDSGNVIITGLFQHKVVFDSGSPLDTSYSNGGSDVFILKLNSSGNFVWKKTLGGTNFDVGFSIIADAQGNIYTGGEIVGTVDMDPGTSTDIFSTSSGNKGFIQKLSNNGSYEWSKVLFGNANRLFGLDLNIGQNQICATGEFNGIVDFDPGPLVFNLTSSATDAYVLKLDTAGSFIFAMKIGGTGGEWGNSVNFDIDGNIIVGGTFTSIPCDFDPGGGTYSIASVGGQDAFVVQLDSLGNFNWAKSWGGSTDDQILSVASDHAGRVYVDGYFENIIDLDPGLLSLPDTSNGGFDILLCKLDSEGNFIWGYSFGGSSSDWGYGVTVDNHFNVYSAGFYINTANFDPEGSALGNLISVGSADVFIQRFSQDSCSSLSLILDSIVNVSCSSQGYISVHANNGVEPYSYEWNTSPVDYDSVVILNGSGIFDLQITDYLGCQREYSFLICGPGSIGSFDLNVNYVSTEFRPGLSSTIWLNGFNDGCDTISGNLSIVLDTLVNYNFAIPPPDNISGDTLVWNFTSISYDSLHITPQIFVTTDTIANIGDVVCFEVFINPIPGDADTTNNQKTYCFPVVNSYDPNIKSVYPQGECVSKYVLKNEKLTYTIQFQNTGTADAINIYLLDTLDANLDLNSVRVIGNSHNVITEVLSGNVLKFRFDNIYLPDSTSDEPNSHGYVIYEVDPLPAVPNNTVINNTAHIFFDFNPAIVTNTVSNRLIDTLPNYSSTQNVNLICGSNYVFPDGTIVNDISANITHVNYLSPVVSCDSVITTNIMVDPIDVTVTTGGFATFTANASGLSYQWVHDCGSGYFPLVGDTNQTFITGGEGNFGVIITNGSCSDTSICYTIGGITNFNNSTNISVFPNPTNNSITISTANIVANKIELKDVYGRTIKAFQPNSSQTIMDLQNIESGIYFVNVLNGDSKYTVKIVKQ